MREEIILGTDGNINEENMEQLKNAGDELKKVQEKSQEVRLEFLKELANRYATENNVSQEKIIRYLIVHAVQGFLEEENGKYSNISLQSCIGHYKSACKNGLLETHRMLLVLPFSFSFLLRYGMLLCRLCWRRTWVGSGFIRC